jgi:hypothetical protein
MVILTEVFKMFPFKKSDIQYIDVKGNKAVVIDLDKFNSLIEFLEDLKDSVLLKDEIEKALQDVREGRTKPWREALEEI